MNRFAAKADDGQQVSAAARAVTADSHHATLRFRLRTILGVSLLFAVTFGVVAVSGNDWSIVQRAFFLVLVCLWALFALAYLNLLLWIQRIGQRRQGGLIQSFGGMATSRVLRTTVQCLALAMFAIAIWYLTRSANSIVGSDWRNIRSTEIGLPLWLATLQGIPLAFLVSRAGSLRLYSDMIIVVNCLPDCRIKYADVVSSKWAAKRDHVLELVVQKKAYVESVFRELEEKTYSEVVAINLRGADRRQVDCILSSKLGDRHAPAKPRANRHGEANSA